MGRGKGRANTTWVEVVRNEASTWRSGDYGFVHWVAKKNNSGDYGFVQVEWQKRIIVEEIMASYKLSGKKES